MSARAAGTSELQLEVATGSSAIAVVDTLQKSYPQLEKILPRCAVAVNGEYVQSADASLAEGDEVALLPPMSGG